VISPLLVVKEPLTYIQSCISVPITNAYNNDKVVMIIINNKKALIIKLRSNIDIIKRL
jgi:hypothetical protein